MPKTRVFCVGCEVFARQLYLYAATSDKYSVDISLLPRDLHNHPQVLRRLIQEKIDGASQYQNETGGEAEDGQDTGTKRRRRNARGRAAVAGELRGPYSLVLVAYGVCGGGTVGLVCRGVPVVVMNRDDCASVLLGSCTARATECMKCPGTWYCHRGDVERRAAGSSLHDIQGIFGPSTSAAVSSNEDFLKSEMERVVSSYSRLLYIKTSREEGGGEDDEIMWAQSQAETNGWSFEITQGTNELIESLLGGNWIELECKSRYEPGDFVVMTKNNEETVLLQNGDRMVLGVKGGV